MMIIQPKLVLLSAVDFMDEVVSGVDAGPAATGADFLDALIIPRRGTLADHPHHSLKGR